MKKQQRIISWLNVFLLIINLSAFATILFMNHKNAPSTSENNKFRSDEFLKEELNLSEDQFKTLTMLDGDVFRSYQVLIDKQCEFNFALLEELSSNNPSKHNLDSIATRIGNYQTLLKKQTIRHFMNIRSICDEEQIQLLDNLLQNMMDLGDKCSVCNKLECSRRDRITN